MTKLSRLTLACIAIALLLTGKALAAPRYDVENWCRQVASVGGSFSNMMFNGCIQQEQAAYDSLKPIWPELHSQTQVWCNEVATVGGSGSYMMLKGCMDQEMRASDSVPRFEY